MSRPMVMDAESVRAILDLRKTQARRVIRPQPEVFSYAFGTKMMVWKGRDGCTPQYLVGKCPYGNPSDNFWVQETWRVASRRFDPSQVRIEYRATCDLVSTDSQDYTQYWSNWIDVDDQYAMQFRLTNDRKTGKWRSPMHMFKWASRITLEITDVSVEQLQEIEYADILEEGIEEPDWLSNIDSWFLEEDVMEEIFVEYWDNLNTKRGFVWDTNPYVWVVKFVLPMEGENGS